MSWINNIVTPKIKEILTKKDVPDNLWIKCPDSGQMVFHKDLEANQWVIPGSNYHMKIPAKKIKLTKQIKSGIQTMMKISLK